jgi:hypothetical protein
MCVWATKPALCACGRLGENYAKAQPPTYWAPGEQAQLWFRGGNEVDQVSSNPECIVCRCTQGVLVTQWQTLLIPGLLAS